MYNNLDTQWINIKHVVLYVDKESQALGELIGINLRNCTSLDMMPQQRELLDVDLSVAAFDALCNLGSLVTNGHSWE